MIEVDKNVTFLVGDSKGINRRTDHFHISIFDDFIIRFLEDLSVNLFRDRRVKDHSDIITFAYWCRRSSILNIKNSYSSNLDRIGKGSVFIVTPSNVPILFAFSLVVSLLAGNTSFVKISGNDFPQVDIICDIINYLLKKDYKVLKNNL
jgi:hypothetical protein